MSLEDLQDKVDNVALNLFEAIRSHGGDTKEVGEVMEKLLAAYGDAISTVDNIKGFHEAPDALESDIKQLDGEYTEVQHSILLLEERLKVLQCQCDEKLTQVIREKVAGEQLK